MVLGVWWARTPGKTRGRAGTSLYYIGRRGGGYEGEEAIQ